VHCNGTFPEATKTGCDWAGDNCTFAPKSQVTASECKTLCEQEPGCHFVTSYFNSVCNLHLMTSCNYESTSSYGIIFQGP
jgi:hypothetical protein